MQLSSLHISLFLTKVWNESCLRAASQSPMPYLCNTLTLLLGKRVALGSRYPGWSQPGPLKAAESQRAEEPMVGRCLAPPSSPFHSHHESSAGDSLQSARTSFRRRGLCGLPQCTLPLSFLGIWGGLLTLHLKCLLPQILSLCLKDVQPKRKPWLNEGDPKCHQGSEDLQFVLRSRFYPSLGSGHSFPSHSPDRRVCSAILAPGRNR